MKSLNNTAIITGIVATILVCLALFTGQITLGNVTETTYTGPATEQYRFFSTSTDQVIFSTSTTAVSTAMNAWFDGNGRKDNGYFVISGAERVTFYMSREGKFGNTGVSTFDVDVSYDGTTWFDYANLKSATSTNTYTTVPLVGTSTAIVSLDLTNAVFYAVRCNVTETTDGEHFCKAQADY